MSRFRSAILFIILALAACVVVGCRPGQSVAPTTPTPTPLPTATPVPSPAEAWARIQATGKIVVGTSADYPPFAAYNENFKIEGFDIALIEAIGEELGLKVEVKDFAFDGLGAAIFLGQIDAAIAAISITPERDVLVDFSQIYFASEDAALARADSTIGQLVDVRDLAAYTVGVQRGSVWEKQLQEELVDTGLMPATNLFTFTLIDQAVRDLRAGRVELVLMDLLPAQHIVRDGGVKVVGQGFHKERYAIAVPNDATALQDALNGALDTLRAKGVIARLLLDYLGIHESVLVPTPTPQPTPTRAPNTPVPAPTATATRPPLPACVDGMAWVADLSYDDANMTNPPQMQPGQPFRKGWRVRNSGTCTWAPNYTLRYFQGNSPYASMGGQPVAVGAPVPPGAVIDLFVNLVAPPFPGVYQGFWQMHNSALAPFGQRIWVGITVVAPQPTAAPTATPSPNIRFWADSTSIIAGQCTTLRWDVTNVREVYVYAEGENWASNGVAGQGSRQVCPPATTNYYLRAVLLNGTVETRQQTITVQPNTQAPQINRFTVEPDGNVPINTCVTVTWEVGGQVDNVRLSRNGGSLWDGAPTRGNLQDCPPGPGDYTYLVEARGPGGTSSATDFVRVNEQPQPEPPFITGFNVSPPSILIGECVVAAWSTQNAVSTRLSRNGQVILDSGPVNTSSVQDCPPNTGPVTYNLDAFNQAGATTSQQTTIVVQDRPQPTPQPPVIYYFSSDRDTVNMGECVTLSWSFGGDSIALAQLFRNGETIWFDVPANSSTQDCPTSGDIVYYELRVDSEFGGSASQTVQVFVNMMPGPLPEPMPLPEPLPDDQPVQPVQPIAPLPEQP